MVKGTWKEWNRPHDPLQVLSHNPSAASKRAEKLRTFGVGVTEPSCSKPRQTLAGAYKYVRQLARLGRQRYLSGKGGDGQMASAAAAPSTGVIRSEGTASSQDPTVGLCLGPYGGPRGGSSFL